MGLFCWDALGSFIVLHGRIITNDAFEHASLSNAGHMGISASLIAHCSSMLIQAKPKGVIFNDSKRR